MVNADLREVCRHQGLMVSGVKSALQSRIRQRKLDLLFPDSVVSRVSDREVMLVQPEHFGFWVDQCWRRHRLGVCARRGRDN